MIWKGYFGRKANTQGASQPVYILMYHAVIQSPLKIPDWCFLDVTDFRTQVKYLKNNFEVVPLSEAVVRLEAKAVRRPTAVITFDDGFQNNYDVAFPILREEGLPATIFLTTGLVGTNDTLWYCRLNRALANTSRCSLEWNGCVYDLSGVEAKSRASSIIQARLKEFPHPQLLAELRKIVISLDDDPDCQIEIDSPFRVLSRDQITDMTSTGLIEIGAHSHSHAILSLLPIREREDEIGKSLATVQELTGRRCEIFAYPNGRKQDYDEESIRILKTLGVRAGVTAIEGLNDSTALSMELRRYGISPESTMNQFEEMLQEGQLATSLLTDGRLGTRIFGSRKRHVQEELRARLPNAMHDEMLGLSSAARATLKRLFKRNRVMSNKPLVSGITIFLNGANFLQEAIESVLAQSYDHWELLLVDDGSNDGSSEIALWYAEQHPHKIRYLEHDGHQNRGKNASRNLGLRHAKGEYIALLDHDDVWLPNKLEDQVRILESLPEAGMMYGRTRFWHSWTGRPEDRDRDGFTFLGIEPETLVRPPHLVTLFLRDERTSASTCGALIRREVAERVGGFDEAVRDIYEDTLFFTKIYLEVPVFVAGECWDCYRRHENNSFYYAMRTGHYHPTRPNPAREIFLSRLEHYISEKGITDAELLGALRTELRLYRNPEERTPREKYYDVLWDAGIALVRGEDPRPLVRALAEVPNPGLDGEAVAEWLLEVFSYSTCRARTVWAELWPGLWQGLKGLFEALEVQAQIEGLADEALRVIELLLKGWFLRVAEGNVARLRFPLDGSDTVRIAIEKANTKPTFDIQLNQPRLEAKSKHQYAINFMARADSPRSICVGFAKAHAPWSNLGLYSKIDLTTEWQSFREVFVATEDDDNARIHFDVGASEIPVDLSSVSLQSLANDLCIESSLSPAVEKERSEISSGAGW